MSNAAKLHHLYSNAAAAQAEAGHYQSRAEHWRALDQRRRDAASMFWKARAARRMADGYLKQAEELQAEEDKQPDMFAAPAESAEIEEALEAFEQIEAEEDSDNWTAVLRDTDDHPEHYQAPERRPITDMDMHTGERFTLLPIVDKAGNPKWGRVQPVIVGKQLTAFEVQTDPNQMELF